MPDQPFSTRTIAWLVGIGLFAFVGMAMTSTLTGDGRYASTSGTNSFSSSAIGHKALVETLQQSGRRIVISQSQSADKAASADLMMVIEPSTDFSLIREADDRYWTQDTFLVLQKRYGFQDFTNSDWIMTEGILPAKGVLRPLKILDNDAELVLPEDEQTPSLQSTMPMPDPVIEDLQLIKSSKISPIIWTDDGILFGSLHGDDGRTFYILSDPDVLSNFGLAVPENAAFTGALMDFLVPVGLAAIVDETSHGFSLDKGLGSQILARPFIYPALAFVLLIAALLAFSARRFGPALRGEKGVEPGLSGFVSLTANLFQIGGYEGEATRQYVDRVIAHVAAGLHAPLHLKDRALADWLDDIAARRGLPGGLRCKRFMQAAERMETDHFVFGETREQLARSVYDWKQEMLRAD
jgi:hypothetical protein